MDAGHALAPNAPTSHSPSVSESSDGDEPPISHGVESSYAARQNEQHNTSVWKGLKQTWILSWILRKPKVVYKHVSNNSSRQSMPRTSIDSDSSDFSSTQNDLQMMIEGAAAGTKRVTFTSSLRELVLSSTWLTCLMVFVPLGAAAYMAQTYPAIVFITNAIAIVPLSALLTDATERIAKDAGDTVGALLNISLGNLVELIIFVALKNGHIRIVCASILGSVLVNLLLILGSALLACSMAGQGGGTYSGSGTQLLGSLLFVSVLAFLMPTAFDYTFQDAEKSNKAANLNMSRASSLIVLMIYVIYILHELRSRRPSIGGAPTHQPIDIESNHPRSRSVDMPEMVVPVRDRENQLLVLPPRTVRFADDSESEVSAITSFKVAPASSAEPDSQNNDEIVNATEERGRRPRAKSKSGGSVYQPPFTGPSASSRGRSRSYSGGANGGGRPSRDSSLGSDGRRVLMRSGLPTLRAMRTSFDEINFSADYLQPEEQPSSSLTKSNKAIGMAVSILALILSSALMSMNAEFLVSTIDDVTHEGGGLSEAIIGLIILPIVGNMAEYITVVTVAVREKLDLAVAVSVGSSIQIALCVTPLTVLASWVLDKEMILTFNFFEMATLVGAVLLVNLIILGEGSAAADPASNTLKGGLMCGCYAIIVIGAYLSP